MASRFRSLFSVVALVFWSRLALAAIKSSEDSSKISISNDRLAFVLTKSSGSITSITLDGQSLLGSGTGLYLDCHCVPGQWVPGSGGTTKLFTGTDSTGKAYAGAVSSGNYQNTGKILEQYWFLRDGETGLHSFSRAQYKGSGSGGDLGEMRVLFRPTSTLWTHLSSSDGMYSTIPSTSGQPEVQDATWQIKSSDTYASQMSNYFTKYMYSETWRDQKVHGMFADGTKSSDGSTFGAWLVMNTKDTYFNGPTHSDLTVDGIVYNYVVSNHHGNGVPEMKSGFDRTFGPQYYYFNKGSKGGSLQTLRNDAAQFANSEWNADFYDSIAQYVPNYVKTSGRGTWKGQITLPSSASKPLAVLSASGMDFQDNDQATSTYQYWADISSSGSVTIPRVKAGTYRLTVYADGIFGQYTQDGVSVTAGGTQTTTATWTAESAGKELWRIGTPDKSSGEFRHGVAKDTSKSLQPNQYRIYWAQWDFPNDFPNGVNFKVGSSNIAQDFNYVHWSVFGGKANSVRTTPYYTNVNNWTVAFDTTADALASTTKATFTVQLAGVKTSAGNTDSSGKAWDNLPYTVVVNGNQLPAWTIPSEHSSSCAVRSAVTCYTTGYKFVFNSNLLKAGSNTFILSLPAKATAPEDAVLPETVYLQYDALRLEVQ